MAWAAALGSVIGSGSEGMASAAQYQASKHERNVAWKRQQQWELIAPSLRMQGLRAAGVNPLLAVTSGMAGGPGNVGMANVGGSPSFDKDSVGRAIASAKNMKAQATELQILRNQEAATRAVARREDELQRQEQIRTRVLGEFGFDQAREELNLLQATVENRLSERMNVNAQTLRMGLETNLLEMSLPGAKALEQFYNKYPEARVLREFGGGSLLGLGAAAGGGAAGWLLRRDRPGRHSNEDFGKLVPGNPKRRR